MLTLFQLEAFSIFFIKSLMTDSMIAVYSSHLSTDPWFSETELLISNINSLLVFHNRTTF